MKHLKTSSAEPSIATVSLGLAKRAVALRRRAAAAATAHAKVAALARPRAKRAFLESLTQNWSDPGKWSTPQWGLVGAGAGGLLGGALGMTGDEEDQNPTRSALTGALAGAALGAGGHAAYRNWEQSKVLSDDEQLRADRAKLLAQMPQPTVSDRVAAVGGGVVKDVAKSPLAWGAGGTAAADAAYHAQRGRVGTDVRRIVDPRWVREALKQRSAAMEALVASHKLDPSLPQFDNHAAHTLAPHYQTALELGDDAMTAIGHQLNYGKTPADLQAKLRAAAHPSGNSQWTLVEDLFHPDHGRLTNPERAYTLRGGAPMPGWSRGTNLTPDVFQDALGKSMEEARAAAKLDTHAMGSVFKTPFSHVGTNFPGSNRPVTKVNLAAPWTGSGRMARFATPAIAGGLLAGAGSSWLRHLANTTPEQRQRLAEYNRKLGY